MRVLIVDDDRIALEILESHLTAWGYEVVSASDGVDALEKFNKETFGIVISDWQMPGMDGLELLNRIRASQSKYYVYCVLLTVRSHMEDLVEGMEAGADDFLSKPFDTNELRVRLRAGQRIIELERRLSLSNTRMERELRTAASVQQSMLPSRLHTGKEKQFAWSYRPCDELGGDILNIVPLGQDQIALYLLDVAGHGVSAALVSVALSRLLTTSTNSSTIIRDRIGTAPAPDGYRIVPPSEVLTRLNDRFYDDLGGERFFTMMYGIFNIRTNEFCYASGGHNPALLIGGDGQVKKLASTGTVVGILEDVGFDQVDLKLKPNDRLLVYSDGITEAGNPSGQQFGEERLIDFVVSAGTRSIQETLDELMQLVEAWAHPNGLQDDVSCLAAHAL